MKRLLIVVIILLLCGGGYGYRAGWGPVPVGGLGTVAVILLILWLLGVIR